MKTLPCSFMLRLDQSLLWSFSLKTGTTENFSLNYVITILRTYFFRGGEIGTTVENSFSVMYPKAFGSVGLDAHTVACSIRKLTLKSTKFYSHYILFSYLENLVKLFHYESTFFW